MAESLLISAMSFFKEEKVNIVRYQVIKGHPFEALSQRYGFRYQKKNPLMFYNYLGEEKLHLDRIPIKRVHFSMGEMAEI